MRGPSELLRAHWPADDGAGFALYTDFGGLARTGLGQLVLPLVAGLKAALVPEQLQCLKDVMAGVQEVLVLFGGETTVLTLVRFDENAASPKACVAAWGASTTPFAGAIDAYRLGNQVAAHLPGLLLVGSEAQVARGIARVPVRPVPASLALAADQYVAWTLNEPADPQVQAMTGRLAVSGTHFRVDVEAEVEPHIAAEIEAMLQAAKAAPAFPWVGPEQVPLVQALLGAATVKRDGKHVAASLDLEGSSADQMRDLSVAIYAARTYLASVKTAEARTEVHHIATAMVAAWEGPQGGAAASRKAGGKKKIASLGPVPKAVPSGTTYASTADDWKPWASIGFSMQEPQRFQYEVRAAPDGQSADIVARGDLNGDGKTSLFRLPVVITKDGRMMVSPSLEETDPEE